MNIKRVCVIDSTHAFLLYLLLSDIEEIEQTFFFWGNGVAESVKRHFEGRYCNHIDLGISAVMRVDGVISKIRQKFEIVRLFRNLRKRFTFLESEDVEFWGHDHLSYSMMVIGKHNFEMLEDGTMNYYQSPNFNNSKGLVTKLMTNIVGGLYGINDEYLGCEPQCSKIHLTGLLPCPAPIIHKTSIKSFGDLWKESSIEKRNYINSLFDITKEDIENWSQYDTILMTQTFSEDKILSEQEKVDLYSRILKALPSGRVILKPHPREVTNYEQYYSDIPVMRTKAPMQLLSLNGVKFSYACAVSSTAVLDLPYHVKVSLLGTSIDAKLYAKYSDIHFDLTGKDVELVELNID